MDLADVEELEDLHLEAEAGVNHQQHQVSYLERQVDGVIGLNNLEENQIRYEGAADHFLERWVTYM